MPHFLLACLLACCLPLALAAGSSPRDLGVVPVPSTNTRAELPLVVFMTGDGGWAALDKGVSTRLAAAGWPVIGWSTLTYFWHKKTPEQVTAGSHRTVWWMCPNGHIWKAIVYSRAGPQKCGCPVCAGKVRPERQERYRRALAEVEAKQAGQPIPGPKEKHNRRNEK